MNTCVTSDQKATIQQQLKLRYVRSEVLQDDPCTNNCNTANHNLNVMHHASSTMQQLRVPHMLPLS